MTEQTAQIQLAKPTRRTELRIEEFSEMFEQYEDFQQQVVRAFLVLALNNGITMKIVLDSITAYLVPGDRRCELLEEAAKCDWTGFSVYISRD